MLSVIGPIAGGWIVQTKLGWRFNFWLMMMVSGCALTIGFLATPETVSTLYFLVGGGSHLSGLEQFAPALLRKRARKLQKASGGQVHYVSKYDLQRANSLVEILKMNLTRPFGMLSLELQL